MALWSADAAEYIILIYSSVLILFAFFYVIQQQSREEWSFFFILVLLFLGTVFTILEEFLWPNLLNLLEHFVGVFLPALFLFLFTFSYYRSHIGFKKKIKEVIER